MMHTNDRRADGVPQEPAASVVTISELRCEYLHNPLGIDQACPRLGWRLESQQRNQKQTAYQIIVSDSEVSIDAGLGNLWDSGKVRSGRSQHITYGGEPLSARQRLYWRVRVWDQDDKSSAWSGTAFWEMSFLDKADWQARWIGRGEDAAPDLPRTEPAPYFRKEFSLPGKFLSARAYITGLGYYEFYLNGRRVGDQVLAPAQTNYDRRNLRHLLYPYDDRSATRVFYQTFDVSAYLKAGKNTAGVILGNGWYNQRDRREEGWMWYDTPRFIAQLEVLLPDGTRQIINSDGSWRFSSGALQHDAIFSGEIFDARFTPEGWAENGFDDTEWQQALPVRSPSGCLESQLAPADKVTRIIRPVSVSKIRDKLYSYDMGQMISGWIRLEMSGTAGDTVSIRYIEEMGKDYGQQDIYVLSGRAGETYEPRFTWHAFRHVEVSGLKEALKDSELLGMVVNTALDTTGTFECSNELFNKIYVNYLRTQMGNMHGCVSSDCPHRERLGYTGDGQILAESVIFSFDMTQFYQKWINDMADVQHPVSGFVPHTAPFGGGGGGPAWGSACITVPWFYYVYYGDTEILRRHYQGMKKWIAYLGTRTDERGLVVREEPGAWCLGDWATPGPMEIPSALVNTSYYYYVTEIMSRISAILGRRTDEEKFATLAKNIGIALNKNYYNTDRQCYWQGRQGSDVFPLAFNMVTDADRPAVLNSLAKNIIANKGHLDTGILATPLMLEVLTAYGFEDLAYTIMDQRDYPGYGDYILGKQATTLWEYWDGKLSHSHPMYGSVVRWFFKALAGINPDPQNPGFRHIIVKPVLCGDLIYARAAYNSVHGKISSSWQLKDSSFYLDVEIPANTSAEIYIPATDPARVSESDRSVSDHRDLEYVAFEKKYVHVHTGSGKYHFVSADVRSLIKPIHVSTPQISPSGQLFLIPDTAKISIATATPGADIHYRLNGEDVDRPSPIYHKPLPIHESSSLITRAFKEGYLPSFSKTERINFADPQKNGLHYTVLEGSWKERPDTSNLRPVSSGIVYNIDLLTIPRREDYIAVIFEGYLEIQNPGDYSFYLSANDGSLLTIDHRLVIDNAGYSGNKQSTGKINLTKGRKKIKILYFENSGSESIDLTYEGPGIEKQAIPANSLFREL